MTIFRARGFEQIFPTRDENITAAVDMKIENDHSYNLDDLVSKYLFFKDNRKKMEKKFVNKLRRESSPFAMFCIHVVISFYIFLSLSYSLDRQISDVEIVSVSFAAVFSFFNGFLVIMGLYFQKSIDEDSADLFSSHLMFLINCVPVLENVYMISTSVSVCLILLIVHLSNKECDEKFSMLPSSLLCLSEQNVLHPTILSIIWILPLILYTTLRTVKWLTVILTVAMNLVFIILLSLQLRLNVDLSFCITIAPLVAICLVENRRQSLRVFISEELKDNQVSKSEAFLIASHAVEMKHMIANIAHDMKTPLTAFISGVDVIASVVNDCDKIAIKEKYSGIGEKMVFVRDCIESIKHINAFMLMSINRCIDYTKASNGVKLVPRLETINLMDIINLPISIMKDIQSKTTFNVKCLSDDICSHIITDGQWLQENILCLVSNAAKYTKNGTVDISFCVQKGSSQSSFLIKNSLRLGSDSGEDSHESSQNLIHSVDRDYTPTSMRIMSRKPTKWDQIEIGSLSLKFTGLVEPIKEVDSPSEHLFGADQAVGDRGRFATIVEDDVEQRVASRVSAKDGPLFIHFEVEDNGIGISPDMLGNLFRPFKQAQRMTGGAGLGLYCLAKRVETLEGYFGVTTRRDGAQGSLFWFEIPYRPDADSATSWKPKEEMLESAGKGTNDSINYSPSPSVKANQTSENKGVGKKTDAKDDSEVKILNILVVDDSPPILKMTSMLLRKNGHIVTCVEDGAAAVEQVKIFRKANNRFYDVILMDLQMPVMDGLEATKRIRTMDVIERGITRTPVSSKSKTAFHTRDDYVVISNTSQRLAGHHSRRVSMTSPPTFELPPLRRRLSSFSVASNLNYEVTALNEDGDALSDHDGSSFCEPNRSFVLTGISPVKKSFAASIMDNIPLLPFDYGDPVQENLAGRSSKNISFPIHTMPLTVSSARTYSNYQYIIGVSANSDADTIQQAFIAGVDAFIPKPFTLQTFNTTFAKLKMINSDAIQPFREYKE